MSYQTSRRYEKKVNCYSGIRVLEIDVISTIYPEKQAIYDVMLADVSISEINLDGGRFARYVDETQPHNVDSLVSGTTHTFKVVFTEMLDWISQHVKDTWSFTVDIPNLGENTKCYIKWSFKSLDDALLFKLTF